jgi:O-antigen/teichoic acid export membrane protein
MKLTNSISQQRFSINVSSNLAAYAVSLLIGLWFTPYLIRNLGVAAYGLIPLANSISAYMSIITLSLNGAVGRYFTIDIQRGKSDQANITFNTALVGSIAISLASLPLVIGIVIGVPYFFDIPNGNETAAQLLFFFILFSFFVTAIESCFSVSSWAKSRFDLRNAVIISSNILRVLFVVVFFKFTNPGIWQVGAGILFASLFGLAGDILVWRKLTPELSIAPRQFDRSRIRELFSMGGWMVVNQIGTLMFLNIDLIVANTVLGAKTAGEYGSILIFSTLLRGLAGTVSGVLSPIVVGKYAINDLGSMTRISIQAIRLMGVTVALPVGLICGLGGPFLQLWLGQDFGSLWLLLVLMIFHLSINLAVLPLFGIQTALNKVKLPGIVTLVMGMINLMLALFFTIFLKWGVYGIAGAAAIVLTLKNLIFTPVYGAYIQNMPWYTYLQAVVPGLVATLLIGIVSFGSTLLVHIDSWANLFLIGGLIAVFSLAFLFCFGLKKEDKSFILGFVPSFGRL